MTGDSPQFDRRRAEHPDGERVLHGNLERRGARVIHPRAQAPRGLSSSSARPAVGRASTASEHPR